MAGGIDITGGQVRQARGLLGWSETDLALRANIDAGVIRNFESGTYPPSRGQRDALRSALVAAGVDFGAAGEPGARLRGEVANDGIHPRELTTENDGGIA
ncbi:helix-turn-helix domain-containing protein [Methylobacterium sp. JK268]